MNLDDFADAIVGELAAKIEQAWTQQQVAELPGEYLMIYADNAKVTATSDTITCTLKGKIPGFIEHGLGPKLGQEGPFDIRVNVLKDGKQQQTVQVAPGVFRTMSWKGKPWIHPGFKRQELLKKVQADLPAIMASVIKRDGA